MLLIWLKNVGQRNPYLSFIMYKVINNSFSKLDIDYPVTVCHMNVLVFVNKSMWWRFLIIKGRRSKCARLKILPALRITCNFSCELGLIHNFKFWSQPKIHHVASPLGGAMLLRLGKLPTNWAKVVPPSGRTTWPISGWGQNWKLCIKPISNEKLAEIPSVGSIGSDSP